MSFNINSVSAAAAIGSPAKQASPAGRSREPGASAIDEAVHVDTFPSSPPPEVHDAIAVAAGAHERLAQSNRAMHFHIDDRTGTLSIEVHDLEGNVLFTVPATKALDVAAGGSLE